MNKKYLRNSKRNNIRTQHIFNLPLKKNLFECVVSVGVLAEHAPLNDEIYEEVGRILKSGGLFLFTAQKIGIIPKLKVKAAQLLFPMLSHSFKERFELYVKSFHTRLNHNEQTIKRLAKQHDLNIQEIEIHSLTKSNFYFVCARKEV